MESNLKRFNTQAVSFLRPPLSSFRGISISNLSTKKFCFLWLLILVVTFLVQESTIGLLPHLQQDEVQIAEYGRLAMDPRSNWSINWLIGSEKPLLLWSYIGPLIAEVSFHLGGASGTGPRIASLIGGLFAGTMALGWLLSRGVGRFPALCLSLAFLLDPLFGLSQRMARVDSWVITLCLASCWLLHSLALKTDKLNRVAIMAAGGLAAMAELTWPSAIFLYPLIALELINLIQSQISIKGKMKSLIFVSSSFVAGGLLCIMLLLLPVFKNIPIILNDMANMVSLNVKPSRSNLDTIAQIFSYHPWMKLFKAYIKTFSPFLPLIGFIGALYKPNKGVILMFSLALILMFATLVYEFRVLYLLPYFLVLTTSLFQFSPISKGSLVIRRIGIAALCVMVVWSIGISLITRTALGLKEKTQSDRSLIYKAASSTIGQGNYNVFLGFTYEFYFVGRSLGWRLYTPYIQFQYDSNGNWLRERDYEPTDKFLKLLSKMNFAIFPKGAVDDQLSGQLAQAGLNYQKTFFVSDQLQDKANMIEKNRTEEVFLWFLIGRKGYGPYQLYSRTESSIINVSAIR